MPPPTYHPHTPPLRFSVAALRPWAGAAALVWGLGLAAGHAWAERADRDKPMNIESDALRYDDTRQTSVFTGNVVLTKGTIVLRGGQLDVQQDGQGNQVAVVRASADALAFFRQKREGLNEFIEAEAERIDYDSRTETVVLTGQAVFRRYRGAQLNDETAGTVIVYDGRTEVFTVQGGGANATAANPSGRVRALITPANGPAADSPAPQGPGPALQPSLNLERRQ